MEVLHEKISDLFNKIMPFSPEEIQLIATNAKLITIPKKTIIANKGKICNEMYYVISGCLRLYYEKEDQEINCFFFHEGLFCTVFASFMMQKPSEQILETVEDTVCLMLHHNHLKELYTTVPKMNVILRVILMERYANAHDIIGSFILDNPEKRYIKFNEKYPLLVNRLPDYHIASYLGITPKSLSRLKKRIYSKAITK
jgi:CRP/FNR family transcriptional regulator, anaerobic regulatory protein